MNNKLTHNPENVELTFALSGSGVGQPVIGVEPEELDFGEVSIGESIDLLSRIRVFNMKDFNQFYHHIDYWC